MLLTLLDTVWITGTLIFGLVAGYALRVVVGRRWFKSAQENAERIIEQAQADAGQIKKEAALEIKASELRSREALERDAQEKQRELIAIEKRLAGREEAIDKRIEGLEERDRELKRSDQSVGDRRRRLDTQEEEVRQTMAQARSQLEKVSGLTTDEAKRTLVESITEEARLEAAKHLRQIDEETRADVKRRAQQVISLAIERMASDYVSERSVSSVTLPNEDMKGRIIGREGRNIRALEALTGVEIVIDDSPDTVTVSCFNPIRREVARRTLEELLRDGRIHPARIEEIFAKMEKEVNVTIKDAGEQAVMELGLHRLHPELVRHMGMLKYRYSYAQNVLQHSIDVGFLCGMMGAELGINPKVARRAGFLHDIGKALTHEVEGAHALIGMDLCKKYGEQADVCHAVGAHHEDIPQETPLDCLVDASDALSGARPGARREVLETYMKRLEDLEKLTLEFKGVEKAYAIQAGREVRVMVKPQEISDAQATLLSKDIARKIESDLTYPGQIKITVIREMRAVDVAR